MKKNKMMRLASVLLVAVLLTTSIISGTFAKYVTSGDKSDSARVAKFGVVITAAGSLFNTTYITHDADAEDDGDTDGLSVVSTSGNVVAPGTNNANGITITLSGVPEVDVRVAFDFSADDEDVFLDDYYPIVYTLTKDGTSVKTGTLAEIEEFIGNNYAGYYNANTDLSDVIGALNLTWAWDFDDSGAGTNDVKDTTLGDLAAGINPDSLEDGEDYNLTTSVDVTISVTQVD